MPGKGSRGGLSSDPAKRRKQLAGLAVANPLLAARLDAGGDVEPAPKPAAKPAPPTRESPPPSPTSPATVAGIPVQTPSTGGHHDPETEPEREPEHRPAKPEPDPEREPEPEPERRGVLGRFFEGFGEG